MLKVTQPLRGSTWVFIQDWLALRPVLDPVLLHGQRFLMLEGWRVIYKRKVLYLAELVGAGGRGCTGDLVLCSSRVSLSWVQVLWVLALGPSLSDSPLTPEVPEMSENLAAGIWTTSQRGSGV